MFIKILLAESFCSQLAETVYLPSKRIGNDLGNRPALCRSLAVGHSSHVRRAVEPRFGGAQVFGGNGGKPDIILLHPSATSEHFRSFYRCLAIRSLAKRICCCKTNAQSRRCLAGIYFVVVPSVLIPLFFYLTFFSTGALYGYVWWSILLSVLMAAVVFCLCHCGGNFFLMAGHGCTVCFLIFFCAA